MERPHEGVLADSPTNARLGQQLVSTASHVWRCIQTIPDSRYQHIPAEFPDITEQRQVTPSLSCPNSWPTESRSLIKWFFYGFFFFLKKSSRELLKKFCSLSLVPKTSWFILSRVESGINFSPAFCYKKFNIKLDLMFNIKKSREKYMEICEPITLVNISQ